MTKKILTYLGIAVIAYALGTISILSAAEGDNKASSGDAAAIKQLSDKIDKVLANQEEMKTMLKRVYVRS